MARRKLPEGPTAQAARDKIGFREQSRPSDVYTGLFVVTGNGMFAFAAIDEWSKQGKLDRLPREIEGFLASAAHQIWLERDALRALGLRPGKGRRDKNESDVARWELYLDCLRAMEKRRYPSMADLFEEIACDRGTSEPTVRRAFNYWTRQLESVANVRTLTALRSLRPRIPATVARLKRFGPERFDRMFRIADRAGFPLDEYSELEDRAAKAGVDVERLCSLHGRLRKLKRLAAEVKAWDSTEAK